MFAKEWQVHYESRPAFCGFHTQQGFHVFNKEVLEILSEFLKNKKVLEIGSGTGYLCYHLRQNQIDIIGTDCQKSEYFLGGDNTKPFNKTHTEILMVNGIELISKDYDVVLMCWPDYDESTAYDAAFQMEIGQTLIYQGEGHGGCTADDTFHDFLYKNFEVDEELTDKMYKNHIKWFGIHDDWNVYKKISHE